PPIGKPVVGSRGPAWFSENPRRLVPPPANNLSGSGMSSSVHSASPQLLNASSIPNVVERANTSAACRKGVYVEFCTVRRTNVAVEPSDLPAKLTSAVLKLPRVASAGLSRRSRTQLSSNPETFVGWLKSGTSATDTFRLLRSTVTYRKKYRVWSELLDDRFCDN